jgi:16S rRNA (guanine527-N7)-methyltransferase
MPSNFYFLFLTPMEKLKVYQSLVKRYHYTLDLVSNVALEHFDKKIADSLVYSEIIQKSTNTGSTVLDVGSGVGLPGLVMAIALPQFSFHLVERRQKRASFLKIVVSQLELKNVKVHWADVTELTGIQVDVVTALAVGTFKSLYCLTRGFHKREILLLSRKGSEYERELAELEQTIDSQVQIAANIPLKEKQTPFNLSNVSRETIYGSLIVVKVLGGLECVGM